MASSMGESWGQDQAFLVRAVHDFLGSTASDITFRRLPGNTEGTATAMASAPSTAVVLPKVEVWVGGALLLHLVVKPCSLRERVALALLDGVEAVPRAHVEDTSAEQTMNVVMVDAGQSMLMADERGKQLAATALSEVHARFLGRDHQLSELPALTSDYLRGFILSASWRTVWATSMQDERFQDVFGAWVAPLEDSAAQLADDLLHFSQRLQLNTLTHTNLSSQRIVENDGRALILSWSQARRAPLFLDLGETFDTAASAQIYREALAVKGWVFADDVFSKGHLLARRFAGLRQLPFRLHSWARNPQQELAMMERTLAKASGVLAE